MGDFVVVKHEHICDPPSAFYMRSHQVLFLKEPFSNGTIWLCECGQNWEYEYSRYDTTGRLPWFRISERRARKLIKKNGRRT